MAFIYMPFIFQTVILAPAKTDFWTYRMLCELGLCLEKLNIPLQNRTMAGQFTTHLTASLIGGIIFAFPYVIWEIWSFIKPALYPKEVKMSLITVLIMPVLFLTGILFGYFIISPLSINFLANYQLDVSVTNQFDLSSYIATLCIMVLGSGLIFQLPVLIYFLSVIGIVTPQAMRKYRKYSVIGIFIAAGVLTPSPDILSQVLVALPLYMLYEISIYVSAYVQKRKSK